MIKGIYCSRCVQTLNLKHMKCIEKTQMSVLKKKEKLYEQFLKRQERDYKNFRQKMQQTRNEMIKAREIEFENIRVKFRAQLQQLELMQRTEQIHKEKFLKNFDPQKSTNIDRVYLKLLNESVHMSQTAE